GFLPNLVFLKADFYTVVDGVNVMDQPGIQPGRFKLSRNRHRHLRHDFLQIGAGAVAQHLQIHLLPVFAEDVVLDADGHVGGPDGFLDGVPGSPIVIGIFADDVTHDAGDDNGIPEIGAHQGARRLPVLDETGQVRDLPDAFYELRAAQDTKDGFNVVVAQRGELGSHPVAGANLTQHGGGKVRAVAHTAQNRLQPENVRGIGQIGDTARMVDQAHGRPGTAVDPGGNV